jgi:hypothetical protein
MRFALRVQHCRVGLGDMACSKSNWRRKTTRAIRIKRVVLRYQVHRAALAHLSPAELARQEHHKAAALQHISNHCCKP